MTAASPVVFGPGSIGLARNEAGEPVVVLPAKDASTVRRSASKTSYSPMKVDVVGTTCADVFSEIVTAEREHFASTGGRVDLRANHVAVTADVWRILCGDFGQTCRSGAEMLLRTMPWIDDVRVLTGRLARGMAFIY